MKDRNMETINIEGLEEIGHGATSRVYLLDTEKVIKAYYPWMKLEEVERERTASRACFRRGVPTANAYELVRAGDGYGVIYDRIQAVTLAEVIRDNPGTLKQYAEESAGFLRRLHQIHFSKEELPDTRQNWWQLCSMGLVRNLTPEQKERLHSFLMSLPGNDTFVHGDYHARNIMLRDGQLFLIDVGDASCGMSVMDLSAMYMACIILPKQSTAKHIKNIQMNPEQGSEFWNTFFRAYLGEKYEEIHADAEEIVKMFALFRQCMTYSLLPSKSEDEKSAFLAPRLEQLFAAMEGDGLLSSGRVYPEALL